MVSLPRLDIDTLITYNVSRPYPFGRWFHVLSLLIFTAVTVLFAVWAAATSGYSDKMIVSTRYNITDNKHWYSHLPLMERQSSLCQPVTIRPGDTITTTLGLFKWTYSGVSELYSSSAADRGAGGLGSHFNALAPYHTQQDGVDVNDGEVQTGYQGTTIERCDVGSIDLWVDLSTSTVKSTTSVVCNMPGWQGVMTSSHTDSNRPSSAFNMWPIDAMFLEDILLGSPQMAHTTFFHDYLNALAQDVQVRLHRLGTELGSNESRPTVLYMRMLASEPCWNKTDTACFAKTPELNFHSRDTEIYDFRVYSNYSYGRGIPSDRERNVLEIPLYNLLQGLVAAARLDFGCPDDAVNIYTNDAARIATVNTSDAYTDLSPLQGAMIFNKIIEVQEKRYPNMLTHPGPSAIDVQYLCTVRRPKSAAGFIISMVSTTISLWLGFYGLYRIFWRIVGKYFTRHHDNFDLDFNGRAMSVYTDSVAPSISSTLSTLRGDLESGRKFSFSSEKGSCCRVVVPTHAVSDAERERDGPVWIERGSLRASTILEMDEPEPQHGVVVTDRPVSDPVSDAERERKGPVWVEGSKIRASTSRTERLPGVVVVQRPLADPVSEAERGRNGPLWVEKSPFRRG
ncbi:hypothetical protein Q8F55_003381 [Vanrija albida]|uniref:Uncharacterized protein n=1 Tax=Vanrija albida TaxID=181172 RepID=A0ABR3Q4V6_9TREE